MIDQITATVKRLSSSYYINQLFDPIQTHAVYGVLADDVSHVKYILKDMGANRFRIVKATGQLRVICFKTPTEGK